MLRRTCDACKLCRPGERRDRQFPLYPFSLVPGKILLHRALPRAPGCSCLLPIFRRMVYRSGQETRKPLVARMHQVLRESVSISRRPLAASRKRRFTDSPLIWMVLAALAIRLVVMVFLLPEQLDPSRDHWHFGYETGRIARSIVEGRGFSSPLFADTGPTAWMSPIYPYIVAGVFKVFGIYTTASAVVLLSLNALTSALTCIPIFFISRRTFGERAAKWSGWTWVFFPYAVYFPVERIWETWLATLLLSLLFLFALELGDGDRKNPSNDGRAEALP